MIRWFIDTDDLDEAWRRVPWAAEILECEGGFWAFESVADAMQWENNQPGDAISDDEARRRSTERVKP
jgi:hypothetical protein